MSIASIIFIYLHVLTGMLKYFFYFPLERVVVTFGDVLHFMTGTNCMPAVGFERVPSIQFTDAQQLPVVSTCALSLTLPRSCANMSFEKFQEMMDNCIVGSCGFGSV